MSTVPKRPPRGNRSAASMDVWTRLDAVFVARLDALAPFIAPLGSKPSRSMAVRACIITGLDALEAKHGKGIK